MEPFFQVSRSRASAAERDAQKPDPGKRASGIGFGVLWQALDRSIGGGVIDA
jgi:hypothetical protein